MLMNNNNFFEKNKTITIITIITIVVISLIIIIICSDIILHRLLGLGRPVLYDSNPIYGYRPYPNKEYSRFWGSKIAFNNLSLRAESNWDDSKFNKVLFLGDSVTYGGSYIDNYELFSYLSVKMLKNNFISGNAGVNGWGVENVYGLIVETNFTPAKIYVSVFPECDFYRGLVRLQGLPFFNLSPNYAVKELWYYFCYMQNNKRYLNWQELSNEKTKQLVVEKAIRKLKQMDNFLHEHGYKHFIFISPTMNQVLKKMAKDKLVKTIISQHQLKCYYIVDDINLNLKLTNEKIVECYHDSIHLSKKGHRIWSKIISTRLRQVL